MLFALLLCLMSAVSPVICTVDRSRTVTCPACTVHVGFKPATLFSCRGYKFILYGFNNCGHTIHANAYMSLPLCKSFLCDSGLPGCQYVNQLRCMICDRSECIGLATVVQVYSPDYVLQRLIEVWHSVSGHLKL